MARTLDDGRDDAARTPTEGHGATTLSEARAPLDLLRRTILVVADDADMRLYLRSCLRAAPAPFDRVIEAADGLEALRLVRSEAVSVVIAGVNLPGLDGRRLTRAIRDDASLRHIVVLLVSGDGVPHDGIADGFLLEPFNSRQLLAALEKVAPQDPASPRIS